MLRRKVIWAFVLAALCILFLLAALNIEIAYHGKGGVGGDWVRSWYDDLIETGRSYNGGVIKEGHVAEGFCGISAFLCGLFSVFTLIEVVKEKLGIGSKGSS
jgi:hypothetical protein